MVKKIERAPVRIQIWLDGARIDVRAWADEFNVLNDPGWYAYRGDPFQGGVHNFRLIAHTNGRDKPWKFERGKPAV